MARSYTATSQAITVGTRAIPTTGTLAVWWYPTFAQGDSLTHIVFDVRNDANNVFHVLKSSSNGLFAGWFTAATSYRAVAGAGLFTLNQNAWNSLIVTWDDAANETFLYLNGVQIATNTSLVTFATTGTRHIGNFSSLNSDARGRLAELVICNRVWSSGERAAFNAGVPPNRLGSTDGYYPLWGGDATEPDLSGNGNTGTVTGATRANHAPVLPFSRRWWGSLLEDVSAGSALTQQLSEVLNFTDTRAQNTGKSLPETLTLTDTRSLAAAKALAEAWGLADARALTPGKGLAEALALADARALSAAKSLTEGVALSDTATLLLLLTLELAESLTLTDSRAMSAAKALVESLGLTDARTLVFSKTAAETLTLTDAGSRGLAKALAEAFEFTDSRTLEPGKVLAESVSFADAVEALRALGVSLSETLTFTDGRSFDLAKALAEALAFSDQVVLVLPSAGPVSYGGSVSFETTWGGTVTVVVTWGGAVELAETWGGAVERAGDE